MKQLLIVILFINGFISVYSQEIVHFHDSLGYDSIGRKQGFWKYPTTLNIVLNEKLVKGVECWEYGYFVDGWKDGYWNVKNEKGKIIGHRIYQKDTLLCEIQYRSKKITSIIRSEYTPAPVNDDGINSYGKFIDIISFNKRGKVKQRTHLTPEGKTTTEKY